MNRVKQLTYTFPENATTSNGGFFWSAPKRFPKALVFSSADQSCLSFVTAAAILRAETYGISVPDWVANSNRLAEEVDKIQLPPFQPKEGVKIVTDEKATSLSTASLDDSAVINQLIKVLDDNSHRLPTGFQINPVPFEKVNVPLYNLFILWWCSIHLFVLGSSWLVTSSVIPSVSLVSSSIFSIIILVLPEGRHSL